VAGANSFEAFDVIRVRANAYLVLGNLDLAHATARDLVEVARSRRRRNTAADLLSRVEAQLAVRDGRAIEP
jgi:hypothetical protein